jgi:P-type conjugative transfer protein TrbG
MDPRRFLIPLACGLVLSGCAILRPGSDQAGVGVAEPTAFAAPAAEAAAPQDETFPPTTDGEPLEVEPQAEPAWTSTASLSAPVPYVETPTVPVGAPVVRGRDAIAAANRTARAASSSDAFIGGVQVFAWSPGRVYEVWAAPLRVTTLTLAAGETILSKAAGDTVRWQIGEATSGAGPSARTHIVLKPLERGLETNLILTTNRRVYLIDLRSGSADAFNTAVAWDAGPADAAPSPEMSTAVLTDSRVPDPVVLPAGPLDGRYRIEPQGRRARWTPTSVFNDGQRTFITFDPDLQVDEAPALFVIAPDGEAQMVNYRQVGGLFVVDRVFARAELRLGDRRPQIVRIRHLPGDRS